MNPLGLDYWAVVLLGGCLLSTLVLLAGVITLWSRARQQTHNLQDRFKKLEQQIVIATNGAVGMGNRIVALEQKVLTLQDAQDNLAGPEVFAYSQALQMLAQGADAATVASNCGFSNSEAQLMALVQNQLKTQAATKPSPSPAPRAKAKVSHE